MTRAYGLPFVVRGEPGTHEAKLLRRRMGAPPATVWYRHPVVVESHHAGQPDLYFARTPASARKLARLMGGRTSA